MHFSCDHRRPLPTLPSPSRAACLRPAPCCGEVHDGGGGLGMAVLLKGLGGWGGEHPRAHGLHGVEGRGLGGGGILEHKHRALGGEEPFCHLAQRGWPIQAREVTQVDLPGRGSRVP